jgi:glycosyltransferase involved in cell wall biosynthesis
MALPESTNQLGTLREVAVVHPADIHPTGNGNGVRPAGNGVHRPNKATATTVSLVIPAKNEARNLPWVLERMPDCVDEVLIIDGDSSDVTVAMATYCRPGVRMVRQLKPGKGWALRAGFEAARGSVIVMLDADGSMSPEEIPRFLWFLENGYDFVKGSRFMAGGGSLDITPLRRAGNWALLRLVAAKYHTTLTDLCYGFCAFRRRWLDSLALTSSGFEIETEMTIRAVQAGLRIAEVPSLELPRRSGHSNLHAMRDGVRVLTTILDAQRPAGPAEVAPYEELVIALTTPTIPAPAIADAAGLR